MTPNGGKPNVMSAKPTPHIVEHRFGKISDNLQITNQLYSLSISPKPPKLSPGG